MRIKREHPSQNPLKKARQFRGLFSSAGRLRGALRYTFRRHTKTSNQVSRNRSISKCHKAQKSPDLGCCRHSPILVSSINAFSILGQKNRPQSKKYRQGTFEMPSCCQMTNPMPSSPSITASFCRKWMRMM